MRYANALIKLDKSELNKMSKKIKTYVSLFSSAGIGCYGFLQEGFECVATVELLEKRMQIQKHNNKCKYSSGYLLGDVRLPKVKTNLLNEISKWKLDINNELDFVIATPPCQGMSVANHKKNNEIVRNSLVIESILITRKLKPKVFIFENVRSFMKTSCTDTDGTIKSIGEAIHENLGKSYQIKSRVINFKDFGANSSRTRTLVIGIRSDIKSISPDNLFPTQEKDKTLREIIGNLPSLKNMGEILESDIYHGFRAFDYKMMDWISGMPEGQSSFDNNTIEKKPHKIINNELIINVNKNGDKYRRQYWDKVAPCIHTRNDILASQNTIHPSDDRVFSIRELMMMMNIPTEFLWSDIDVKKLNSLPLDQKKAYLKKHELNIRHSIGEAVPTIIFRKIAKNYKKYYEYN